MKTLKCEMCGAPLVGKKCEYCGTLYDSDEARRLLYKNLEEMKFEIISNEQMQLILRQNTKGK